MDLFSTEFLETVKNQIATKSKNSKVLLEAIKELTQTNLNNKKLISQVQAEIAELRNENNMLMEIVESSKLDIENRLKAKDRKIEHGIQIQARLSSQNQAYKNQIQKLRQELVIYKNLSLSMKNISKQTKVGISDNIEKSQTQLVSLNSQNDLNAYLYSQRDKSQHEQQFQRELQASESVSVEVDMQSGEKLKAQYGKSVKQNDIEQQKKIQSLNRKEGKSKLNNQIFYSEILNGDFQDIQNLG